MSSGDNSSLHDDDDNYLTLIDSAYVAKFSVDFDTMATEVDVENLTLTFTLKHLRSDIKETM